jgi:hypothetical protein
MAQRKAPPVNKEFEEKKAQLAEIDEEVILFDGYEEALVGYGYTFASNGHLVVAIYDYNKCLECLLKQGMSEEDAIEWFETNTLGCYAGKNQPVFMKKFTKVSS